MAEHNRQIKDSNGDLIYPITRVSAVPDFDAEAHIVNRNQSAGVVVQPTLIDNLNGTFTVGNFSARVFTEPGFLGDLRMYSIMGGTMTPVDLTLNFLVVDYNGGSPIAKLITNVELIDEAQIIPVSTIYRHGTHIHHLMWDSLGLGLSNKLNQRFVKTQRFARETGLAISEYTGRYMRISAGIVWYGAVRQSLLACDSGIENFHLYYHVAGSYPPDSTHIAVYNNTQYDNGTNLVSALPNKFLINWIYRGIEDEAHVYVVLGIQAYGSLSDASVAQPRADLPDEVKAHAMLIGKIIVKTGDPTASAILSVFDTSFLVTGGVTNHNDLAGLQGGIAAEYFHLTSAELTKLTGIQAGAQVNNISDVNAAALTGGGDTLLHYHRIIQNEVSVDNAKVEALSTGVKVTRNIADGAAAFIVNQQHASSTGYLFRVQFGGVDKITMDKNGSVGLTQLFNLTDYRNARFLLNTTGNYMSRDVADANTALIINQANAASTGRILDLHFAGVLKASVNKDGGITAPVLYGDLANDSGSANARIYMPTNGAKIERNVADGNTALRINQGHASSTGMIADFQLAGVSKANIDKDGVLRTPAIVNMAAYSNCRVSLNNAGVLVERNIADSNSALIVNQQNAGSTGYIQKWQFGGVDRASVDPTGFFNAVRFIASDYIKALALGNLANTNNGTISMANNGVVISRNIADAYPALDIDLVNASSTGNILTLKAAGVTKASIDRNGKVNSTGGTVSGTLVSTSSIPVISKYAGYKSWILHRDVTDSFIFAPSITIDAEDWDWANQIQFNVGGNLKLKTLSLMAASGTAPMTVVSSSLVNNLNSDLLDSQHGSHYLARANHTGTQSADTIVDGSTNHVFTAADDTKLAGIATGANLYVHPATHSADIIVDGTTNHVFTAADDTKLAGIESGATADMTAAEILTAIKTVDGAGSGLDADLLDGSPALAFKYQNWIINGMFDIWQRNTTQSSNGYGSDDRFSNEHSGSTKVHSRQAFTVGQTSVPNNPKYYSRTVVTSVAGVNNYVFKLQKIEDVTKLAGKTITVSFWAKADAVKNIGVEVYQYFGATSGYVTIPGTKFALSTAWQKITLTVAIPSAAGKTIEDSYTAFRFWFDAGSTYNSGSGTLGQQSGTFDMSNICVVEGSVASECQAEPYEEVLRKCQRYYESSFDDGVTPANGPNTTSFASGNSATCCYSSNTQYATTVFFKVPKRVVPTLTVYGNSNGRGVINNVWATNPIEVNNYKGKNSFNVNQQDINGYAATIFHWSANAEL